MLVAVEGGGGVGGGGGVYFFCFYFFTFIPVTLPLSSPLLSLLSLFFLFL